ncbi:TPA: UTP--glucose-1-phosphate uridylyltransferase [Candidatus Saccharibacteria bacterium]|nr:UTP--glucose-1-phosphate uridylyltransferase [Candidatus Saccharibacteria bacterium]HIO87870.1 UTP--glucose-1-phosphate uridylyltransferase [Candidatus Saccharibacteria bacterium]
MQKVTKAVIPAAGLGTRFLPQTKAMPKEMLPIIDKPVIQIVVEELVAVGVTDIIIVTGAQKRAIEDHFDRSVELEQALIEKGKQEFADEIKRIGDLANFIYVRQKGEPKGNARPVLNAAHLIGDEPFFVLFPDDFFKTTNVSRAQQLLDAYGATGGSVISLIEIAMEDTSKYGVAELGQELSDDFYQIKSLVEKPGPDKAPSHFGSVAGYLLTPDLLPILEQEKVGHGGEIVLADAINELAQKSKVYGKVIDGIYHDSGNKLSYLKAIIDLGLDNPDFGHDLRKYLQTRL